MIEVASEIERKLALLKLAEELGSVAAACRQFGVSRDTFYRAKQAFTLGGAEALKHITRKKPNLKNRIASTTEQALLALSLSRPSYGQARISGELAKRGITISPAGVRCVWQRHNLQTIVQRRAAASAAASSQPSPEQLMADSARLSDQIEKA